MIAPHVDNQTQEGFAATRANPYNRTNKALLRAIGHPEPADATDSVTHVAVYYDDPDGNTIELYHDHPREQWPDPYSGSPRMTKVTLDELVALADRELPVASSSS